MGPRLSVNEYREIRVVCTVGPQSLLGDEDFRKKRHQCFRSASAGLFSCAMGRAAKMFDASPGSVAREKGPQGQSNQLHYWVFIAQDK